MNLQVPLVSEIYASIKASHKLLFQYSGRVLPTPSLFLEGKVAVFEPLPEIGGHGSMFPYMYIRILTVANVLRALRASRERSACSQQTSEKLSSNWKHALETRG